MEMTLHIFLAVAVTTAIGGGAPEVRQACYRALELSRQAEDDLQLFPILSVLFGFYLVSAQFQTARELAERLLRLAEQQPEPVLKLAAHLTLAVVLWQMGELPAAHVHFEQRHSLYTPHDHFKFLQFGHDPTVTSLSFAAPVLWLLGYPEQARQAGREAMALAAHLEHPYTHAVTLHFVSKVFHGFRELPIFQTQTEAQLALSREQDFREGIALGMIMQGWIWAHQGRAPKGIVQIREGIARCDAIGTQMDRPHQLAILAEAYALNDQPDEGLAALEDALQYVEKTGGRYYEAELYRLRGELTLQQESQNAKRKSQK
jgi:predicted ATPase